MEGNTQIKTVNRIGVFADGKVGREAIVFLLENYRDDLQWVVCNDEQSEILPVLRKYNYEASRIFYNVQLKDDLVLAKLFSSKVNYIILAWWPHIIKQPIFSIPKIGILNFHPSLLPYNRGKNYNFWTIVENTPFGVSLHFIDEKIDSGDIIFQSKIAKNWLDTGKTLYFKAQKAMIKLFKDKYSDIRVGNYVRSKQDLNSGSFHLAKELNEASKIYLDKKYQARDLINIIRARTFLPYPGAWFEEAGDVYEVRINIKKSRPKKN